ncbi:MAG: penicillin-binding protein 2 [Candidatus Saganbacteria bacterium]|nr:penicillin-binding protein 2 [Candidatus Saganbacteria bacterium]
MRHRLFLLLTVFILLFLLVLLRLADIQILRHGFYQKKSLDQRTRLIKRAAHRGDILDRNGNLLATSIDAVSVYQHKKGWLARKLDQASAEKLQAGGAAGVSLVKEKKRIYPKGRLAAQVIGFAGVDNQGLSGIELAFDAYLKGKNGQLIIEGDPSGRQLYGALREIQPGSNGMDVTLTIDENIQYVAERELKCAIREFKAASGMCLVMDVKTGELLALASEPGFDPNDYQQASHLFWHPSFLDPFEPGSTFKIVTVAAGLAEGVVTTGTRLKSMDRIVVGGKTIENSQPIDWPGPTISLSKMLERSVNTGSVQIGLKLGPEKFYRQIRKFGFGQYTDFGLQGESRGILRHWQHWYKPDVGMITFGQGIAVTPLQLLAAVSVFANDGEMVKPYLVKSIESDDGRFLKVFSPCRQTVVSPEVAKNVKEMMRNVVVQGSGKTAALKDFAVCGKTGTAQKALPDGRGYMKDRYIASFIGFAPAADPRLACLVIVNDPRTTIWGGRVCGPVFRDVVEYSLRYMNARPDML